MRVFKNILFFLILIAILVSMSQMFDNTAKADVNRVQSRNKNLVDIQNEKEDTIDVLVVGDSVSFTSVSPMELWRSHGFTSYICGQPMQNIEESYYMLKTALDSQSPKLVVMETHAWFNTMTGTGGIRQAAAQLGNYYLPVFQYHDLWKPVLVGNYYEEESYKGFIIRDSIDSYEGGEYMKETTKEGKFSYMVRIYMPKIIELCKENDTDLLLVSAPSPKNYNYRRHDAIQEYADEKSLRYLDLNLKTKELGIDWKTDSQDKGEHLNLSGAHKVSKYLGDYLTENFCLPDHRSDASYQEWENLAQKYETKTKEKLEVMK